MTGHEVRSLDAGWELAEADPTADLDPSSLAGRSWLPAIVPGTVAGALAVAGTRRDDLDHRDWWFRTTFDAAPAGPGEELVLRLGGIATLSDVFLNGASVWRGESMFEEAVLDVTDAVRDHNELLIRCRALAPEIARQRRPRPRWRTRLVADNNLRWFRTMLLGRLPGFAPGPPTIGPWRPITLERRRAVVVEQLRIRTRLEGDVGVMSVSVRLRALGDVAPASAAVRVEGATGRHETALGLDLGPDGLSGSAAVLIPGAARWWPHTHGAPARYRVTLMLGDGPGQIQIDGGHVGFRTIAPGPGPGHDIERDGLSLHVNGTSIFARGALWTPIDPINLSPTLEALRGTVAEVREAGMNMLRLPAFGPYESQAFHDLCDELGIMVWQDLAFMSMDYPFDEPRFGEAARSEAATVVEQLATHPSTVVLCGNSEVEQQVAMLALDLELCRMPFYDSVVPEIASAAELDAIYVPSVPWGGELPMRPDRGVTGYYGVGGYGRALSDARTSGIRFAAECLAFANIPDEDALASLVPVPPFEAFVHNPYWKAGVARDAGMGWDFDDIRDTYLQLLFGVDPVALRRADHDRYLALSRAMTGELMALVFGEWRRSSSPCAGGLVLWLRDQAAGAGWGVIDHRGHRKTAWYDLRRAFAAQAVWLVDEGIGGVIAHVANDAPTPLRARLRLGLYADLELPVVDAIVPLDLAPHSAAGYDVEGAIGRFVDAAWAYRFGPPAQDAVVASLEREGEAGAFELVSQAFHFPAGRPLHAERADRLGLAGTAVRGDAGEIRLELTSRRLVYGLRIHSTGYRPSDDGFSLEPGHGRTIRLVPDGSDRQFTGAGLSALNLLGRAVVAAEDGAVA